MIQATAASSDDESIRPVSSLRSRFESLGTDSLGSSTNGPPPKRAPTPEQVLPMNRQTPIQRQSPRLQSTRIEREQIVQDAARKKAPPPIPGEKLSQAQSSQTAPRPLRPVSMLPASPTYPLPQLNVTSPTSPSNPIAIKKVAPQPPATRRSPSPNVRKVDKVENRQSSTAPQSSSIQSHTATHELPSLGTSGRTRVKRAPPPVPPAKRSTKSSANLLGSPSQSNTSPEREAGKIIGKTTLAAVKLSQGEDASVSESFKKSGLQPPQNVLQTPSPTNDQPRQAAVRDNSDSKELRPALPPRRTDGEESHTKTDTIGLAVSRPSALNMGFSPSGRSPSRSATSIAPSIPMQLSQPALQITPRIPQLARANQSTPKTSQTIQATNSTNDSSEKERNVSNSPDSSCVNRRIPYCSEGPRSISMGYDARVLDVCGGLVCTAGVLIRVWDTINGRLLLSMPLGEQIKATAIAFKPSRKIEEEGTTIWVGTDWGELMEIDIASKRVNKTNGSAHSRREVVRILRNNLDMWTVDDEGKLWVWPATAGWPDLDQGLQNARLPRRPTLTLVVDDKLWVANGRELRVFEPASNPEKAAIMHTQQPLGQSGAGEITCGTVLTNSASSPIYIGHSDGKVSVYSRHAPFDCLALLSISSYKINCMLGVGNLLWAGFTLGHMCVYDPSEEPWTVKKEWRTHTGPVIRMANDTNSNWKIASCRVISLGTDESLGIWDGLLKNDWLDNYMQDHQVDYCTYQDVTVFVLTWNAGAVKPADLKRNDGEDSRFFQDLMSSDKPPDILVLGLQELVDLEDKRLTAKSFLKGRHKDVYGQEHLSTAYRAWRDYLTWTLDENMPPGDNYVLLHTASLVGLFTCIFVKAPFRNRIHGLGATEVKTGMGGLHGNKGALLVRFLLDDSSLCFVNCHLAAGQTHTQHRNNDVTSILESSSLPILRLPVGQSEVLTSGGDGTMILDHEICILHGDLNYRIDTMPRESVISAVRSKNYNKLLERDQLLLMHRRNPGFRLRAFTEGVIDFAPTYKYNVGSDEYDTSEKRRVPAWCDRILWRGKGQVEQLAYERHDNLRASDHRPVSSLFNLRIKSIDTASRARVRQQGELKFERTKSQISDAAKLSYLCSYYGLTADEAQQALQKS